MNGVGRKAATKVDGAPAGVADGGDDDVLESFMQTETILTPWRGEQQRLSAHREEKEATTGAADGGLNEAAVEVRSR